MKLYLIRHAQSVANSQHKLISNRRDPLTEMGRTQAENLRQRLHCKSIFFDNIFSSPWQRARETAEIVCLGLEDKICEDENLAETNPGRFENWLEQDFYDTFPNFHKDITNTYEDGESHADMASRVQGFVEQKIVPLYETDYRVAVFTHGGPIAVILQWIMSSNATLNYPVSSIPNAVSIEFRFDRRFHRLIFTGMI